MTRLYPDCKFQYVNKEEKKKFFGLVSEGRYETEMETDRIEKCLEGVNEAVEDELKEHGVKEKDISYDKKSGKMRKITAELGDADVKVISTVKSTKRGTWGEKGENPGPALREDVKTGISRHTGKTIERSQISTELKFESDSKDYEKLYSGLKDRLAQIPENFDLTAGNIFGPHPPNYKSVMS